MWILFKVLHGDQMFVTSAETYTLDRYKAMEFDSEKEAIEFRDNNGFSDKYIAIEE